MQLVCQIVWIALMTLGFIALIVDDLRKDSALGLLFTVLIYGASIALGFGAGVYQNFFR